MTFIPERYRFHAWLLVLVLIAVFLSVVYEFMPATMTAEGTVRNFDLNTLLKLPRIQISTGLYLFYPVLFLAAVIFYFLPMKWQWSWLLVVSSLLIILWDLFFFLTLALVTLVTFLSGNRIEDCEENGQAQKKALVIGVITGLLILFGFKYGAQFTRNSSLAILMPIGLSFYTFQSLSYLVDIYNGKVLAERHFGYFTLYMGFFPKLFVGPIDRAATILPQLKNKVKFNYSNFMMGVVRIFWGVFKRVMLVNRLQVMANNIFAHPQDFSGLEVWAGVFLFGFYLYFDFSSLIDIVMGCGQLFGLHFMENFRQPLFASSVTNFWRRWHISLTSWLRDYVFFPLNFATREVRTKSIQHINIMITFLISGIWHGASLNFIIWGGLHGAYLIVEDLLNTATEKLEARYGLRLSISRSVSTLLTFLAVNFAWIFLLAGSLRETRGIVMKLFTCEQFLHLNYIQMGLEYADLVVTGIFLGLLLIVEGFELKNWRFLFWLQDRPLSARWLIYLVLLFTMIIFGFYGNYSNMIDPYYMKF